VARKILGTDSIIGYSTHSIRQIQAALSLPVDYIAIGPIFQTATKQDPDPPIGLSGLRDVRKMVGDVTLVAIGGITRENLPLVFDAGADSAAVISGIISDAANISGRMRELIKSSVK
jgi:thiamine-phosphate pyrophosphorylase